MVRVRFAPSPTGPLHIGGARTALFNFLFARSQGGSFILRIDDTDRERSKPELEQDILQSLEWLGLSWDEGPVPGGQYGPYRQSERYDLHRAAVEKLLARDAAYRDEEGTVRLRYPDTEIVVEDVICGRCVFQSASLGPEPVMLRSDNTPTYQLASVVDDIEMKISHVIRGQDHLTNTAKQQLIFHGLGAALPVFAHLPLILGKDGGKLSKRNSEALTSVRDFREGGYLPQALVNFLLLLGWSHPEANELISVEEAIRVFSLERVGKTGAIFDPAKLLFLNGWWIRHLPLEEIADHLLPFTGSCRSIVDRKGQAYWHQVVHALRDSISLLTETESLTSLLFDLSIPWSEEIKKFVREGNKEEIGKVINCWKEVLNEFPPDEDKACYSNVQFNQLMSALKKKTGVSGKALFQPLRLAIMGNLSGPELKVLVPLIDSEVLRLRVNDALKIMASAV